MLDKRVVLQRVLAAKEMTRCRGGLVGWPLLSTNVFRPLGKAQTTE